MCLPGTSLHSMCSGLLKKVCNGRKEAVVRVGVEVARVRVEVEGRQGVRFNHLMWGTLESSRGKKVVFLEFAQAGVRGSSLPDFDIVVKAGVVPFDKQEISSLTRNKKLCHGNRNGLTSLHFCSHCEEFGRCLSAWSADGMGGCLSDTLQQCLAQANQLSIHLLLHSQSSPYHRPVHFVSFLVRR